MRELKVTLETVTPLFLGGAESKGMPEVRPPAFRGALRYWLRAMLGGVIGDQNLDGLHELEAAVWGSTDYGSPVHLRLSGNLKCGDYKILPHKEGSKAWLRKAFNAGQSITLTLFQHLAQNDTVWQIACATLALSLTFGGVGLRSRRGYGTLRVVDSTLDVVNPMPKTSEKWRDYIKKVVQNVLVAGNQLAHQYAIPLQALTDGPSRYPCATRAGLIRLSEFYAVTSQEAVRHFMQNVPQVSALGGIKPHRQASPLWVRPVLTENGYQLLLVVLASQLESGTNYQTVRQFLDTRFPGTDIPVEGWNV
ncbi:MAG: type III-B CRISPR module RAMP protein Cmr1 [Anaerolineae bacterium]|nr:type III-B CRISPR module RAMP protein Cmr1 [Anaerolineae bacterium]